MRMMVVFEEFFLTYANFGYTIIIVNIYSRVRVDEAPLFLVVCMHEMNLSESFRKVGTCLRERHMKPKQKLY